MGLQVAARKYPFISVIWSQECEKLPTILLSGGTATVGAGAGGWWRRGEVGEAGRAAAVVVRVMRVVNTPRTAERVVRVVGNCIFDVCLDVFSQCCCCCSLSVGGCREMVGGEMSVGCRWLEILRETAVECQGILCLEQRFRLLVLFEI